MTGKELKELRIAKGLTQGKLSDLSGVAKGTIGRIESNPDDDIKKAKVVSSLMNILIDKHDNENMVSDLSVSYGNSEKLSLLQLLLAEKDKRIAEKDEMIDQKDERLNDKDEIIRLLKEKLAFKRKSAG